MTNNKEEIIKAGVEAKLPEGQEASKVNPVIEKVAKAIQVLLEENGVALQPYLATGPFGIIPQVQLVVVPVETVKEDE